MDFLLETQYLPQLAYLACMTGDNRIVLDDQERFGRQSFRNRTLIAGANGVIPLIIPALNSRKALPIKEVRIDPKSGWRREHWQSIKSSYGKAPFFEYYVEKIHDVYNQEFAFLWDANQAFLTVLIDIFKVPEGRILLYSENPELQFTDWKDHFHPKKQLQEKTIPYYQAFEEKHGFIPGLSSIDYLFNMGAKLP
jgi:hypothetical protein